MASERINSLLEEEIRFTENFEMSTTPIRKSSILLRKEQILKPKRSTEFKALSQSTPCAIQKTRSSSRPASSAKTSIIISLFLSHTICRNSRQDSSSLLKFFQAPNFPNQTSNQEETEVIEPHRIGAKTTTDQAPESIKQATECSSTRCHKVIIRIDMAVPRTLTREEEDTVIAEDTEEEVGISTTIMEGTRISTEEDTLAVIIVEVTKADLIEETATTEATKDTILTENCLEIRTIYNLGPCWTKFAIPVYLYERISYSFIKF